MSAPVLVLLVEDNDADVFLIREALTHNGLAHELIRASDGDQAVDICQRVGNDLPVPDILLLDMNLPKRNGTEVLAAFNLVPACANVPVVIVTSSDSAVDRKNAALLGARHYFRKPSDLDEFLKLGEVVRGTLRRERLDEVRTRSTHA